MPWIATLQTRCARFPEAGLGPQVAGTWDLHPEMNVPNSRTGRSSAPPSSIPPIGTSPSGWSRPHSVTRSPRSVHFQSTWGSTYVATWTPWRSTSKGVT